MNIVERIKRVGPFFGSVGLTIGNFDGFHLGHRKILQKLTDECGKRGLFAAVITFKEHPLKLIRGDAPRLLGPRMEKIRWFSNMGIDILFYIDFDAAFADMKPLEFLALLKEKLGPKLYCLGKSFKFGKNNRGDVGLIRRHEQEFGYAMLCVDDVEIDDKAVSSTRIRNAVGDGEIELANRLLGRSYSVWLMKDSSGRGRLLPFLSEVVLPKGGRYAGEMVDMKKKESVEAAVAVSGRVLQTNSIGTSNDTLYRFLFHNRLGPEK